MTFVEITTRNMSKGFSEILYHANDVTRGWISNLILIAIYIITMMSIYTYKKDFIEGMAVAGFFTFLVGLFFFLGDFISGVTFTFVIAITIISVALLFFNKRR